jgi:hypothetical protein
VKENCFSGNNDTEQNYPPRKKLDWWRQREIVTIGQLRRKGKIDLNTIRLWRDARQKEKLNKWHQNRTESVVSAKTDRTCGSSEIQNNQALASSKREREKMSE